MSLIRRAGRPLAVGIDAGATRVRLRAYRGDRVVATLTSNVARAGDLAKFLHKTWQTRRWKRDDVGALVVASRGIWTPRERHALARRFTGLASRIEVVSDAQAALLGALGLRAGLLVLSGTGSIVIGRDGRGRWARAGGLGPLLGDEGSAFWIGRAWLRVTTRGEDFAPVRRLAVGPNAVPRIAALAPSVLRRARRGDPRARAIVREAQAELARLAIDVAGQLRLPRPVSISWAGGVMGDVSFRRGVARAAEGAGLRARWLRPAAGPVGAAAGLARRALDGPTRVL